VTEEEIAQMRREREEYVRVVTVLLAAERGYRGVVKLMKTQARERPACVLCRRPFYW
jgi:hypothetical protein